MKLKRVLAFLLCLTLCIVPLPFSVHAYYDCTQNIITSRGAFCACVGSTYTVIQHGNLIKDEIIGTATVCSHAYYDNFKVRCSNCHIEIWTNQSTYQQTQHPTFIQTTVNGETVFQCPKCKYIR